MKRSLLMKFLKFLMKQINQLLLWLKLCVSEIFTFYEELNSKNSWSCLQDQMAMILSLAGMAGVP